MSQPAIEIQGLDFSYAQGPPVLEGVDLSIARGVRCLLIGANGAGKTTLLRVLAGRHMIPKESARILGQPAFHSLDLVHRVAFVGGPFPFNVDVTVAGILRGQAGLDPTRLERMMGVLDVDPTWHMHRVSDGQRRRVQILLHLARPVEVVLLDEVTADLDVIARADLLEVLRRDSEESGTTILYATHVLDGLERWATHLVYLKRGKVALYAPLHRIGELSELRAMGESAPLLRLCERWLRAERNEG